MMRFLINLSLFIVFGFEIFAQSLDNLRDQKPITLNGYVSANQVINTLPSSAGNNASYNSFYTGSLNLGIYGINTPITFMYSNNQGRFTHPFNQLGIHPSYKWVKAHIGYSSMSFTPYTLSGHLFLGGGIEVDPPGLFYASAIYGRLNKAVDFDSTNLIQGATYKRMGYGIKMGIAENGNFVDLNVFRAYDVLGSISETGSESQPSPQENSVISVSFNKQIVNNLTFQGEFASSYITTDTKSEKVTEDKILLKPPAWFLASRATTINREAFKSNITYNRERYSIGLGYERVDPEYRTLGAYYFVNNMENMTLNLSLNFFDNKVSLNGNMGLQKDNLDNSKMNNTNRFVGSTGLSFVPNEKLNLNLDYSNFTSFTNVRSTFDYINQVDQFENYDTLNFRQISQNTNFGGNYQFSSSKKKRQSINFNLTWQVSNDSQGNESSTVSNFYNVSTSYLVNITPISLSCNLSINYNKNDSDESDSYTLGPVIGLNKSFFDKSLKVSLTTSYSTSKTQNFASSSIFNVRSGLSYSLKKNHSFNTNVLFQQREGSSNSLTTVNFNFGYVYRFNLIKSDRDKNKVE